MFTEKRVNIGPVEINYAEGDAGGAPFVLLHGIASCWHSFEPVLPLLAHDYHTYALDLRGHGRSGHARCIYEIEDYGEDVLRFLRAQVGQPVVLLGHSLGAEVALWVAAAIPERVLAVVVEEPGLYLFSEHRFAQHPLYRQFSALYEVLTGNPTMEQILIAVQTLWPKADEARQELWTTSLQQIDRTALAQFLDGSTCARTHHDEILAQIKAPVLLLQGNPEREGLLTEQDIRRAQALLPNCTHLYRADLGHNWHSMAPQVFFQTVSSFVERALSCPA